MQKSDEKLVASRNLHLKGEIMGIHCMENKGTNRRQSMSHFAMANTLLNSNSKNMIVTDVKSDISCFEKMMNSKNYAITKITGGKSE